MYSHQKLFLKNKKTLLIYFSEWKTLWKTTTTTFVNIFSAFNASIYMFHIKVFMSFYFYFNDNQNASSLAFLSCHKASPTELQTNEQLLFIW